MKRHTCIICKRKRNESFMVNVFKNSWACKKSDFNWRSPCYLHSDVLIANEIINISMEFQVLNLKYLTK